MRGERIWMMTIIVIVLSATGAASAAAEDCVLSVCVRNANGMMRIVADASFCSNSESLYSLRSATPACTLAPLTCPGCDISQTTHLAGKDAKWAYLWEATLQEADISGTDFTDGEMFRINMQRTNAIGANFTRVWMPDSFFGGTFFHNAVLTEADLSYSSLPDTEFNGAVAIGTDFHRCDFNDTVWTDADLTGADFSNTTFTGTTNFNNTICPDGTNSDTHGNTCFGYGIP